MIDVSQDYEYDTRISPQDMAWYGLKEGEMIRLIGGVCVNKKEYYEICEQKNNGYFMLARDQRALGEILKKKWIRDNMLVRSALLSPHPLYPNTNIGETDGK